MRERRNKQKRSPRRVFLVICEGETEKAYVEALKRHFRIPITIKTRVSGNAVNKRLVNQYIRELSLDNDDDYSLFFIYDADVKEIVERLKSMDGNVILSNPCFELWYLLHMKDQKAHITSDQVLKALSKSHEKWTSYAKGILTMEQERFVMDKYSVAADRAKKSAWPGNPSCNMNSFFEQLEKAKN